jgi:hypothetical protein
MTLIYLNIVMLWIVTLISALLILLIIRKVNRLPSYQSRETGGLQPKTLAPDIELTTVEKQIVDVNSIKDRERVLVFVSPHAQFVLNKCQYSKN